MDKDINISPKGLAAITEDEPVGRQGFRVVAYNKEAERCQMNIRPDEWQCNEVRVF